MSLTDPRKLGPTERARAVEKGIRIAWESLETHLDRAYEKSDELTHEELVEEHEHHKRSVRDYADLIKILASLY